MSSDLPLEFDREEQFGNGDKRRNCIVRKLDWWRAWQIERVGWGGSKQSWREARVGRGREKQKAELARAAP